MRSEHWFDRFTKSFAGSRGKFLVGVGFTGAYALSDPLPVFALATGATELSRRNLEGLRLPAPSTPCALQRRRRGFNAAFSASTTYQNKPLTLSAAVENGNGPIGSVSVRMRIELGGELVGDVLNGRTTVRRNGKQVELRGGTVVYGTGVSGLRGIGARDDDGNIRGTVDGRAFQFSRKQGTTLRKAPVFQPGLSRALTTLKAAVTQQVHTCKSVAAGAFPLTALAQTRSELLTHPLRERTAQRVAGISKCDVCTDECTALGGPVCLSDAFNCAWAIFSDPWGVLDGSNSSCSNMCSLWQNCMNNCYKSGGPCCDKRCSLEGGAYFCCGSDQLCCDGICCDPGDTCAPQGGSYLNPVPAHCCSPGYKNCGDDTWDYFPNVNCIPDNWTCCGGIGFQQPCTCKSDGGFSPCCKHDQIACWNVCCSGECVTVTQPQTQQTYPICCKKGSTGCNQACCDGTCLTNYGVQSCCPKGHHVCGSNCCPKGVPCRTSSSGQKVCCSTALCGDVCCGSPAKCYSGTCSYTPPCGGVFCAPLTQICVNNKCVNRSTPTPNPKQKCPPGLSACPPPINFKGTPACCNLSTQTCCGSVCCNSGLLCQNAYTGQCVQAQ
jgi:hypothetical protein